MEEYKCIVYESNGLFEVLEMEINKNMVNMVTVFSDKKQALVYALKKYKLHEINIDSLLPKQVNKTFNGIFDYDKIQN